MNAPTPLPPAVTLVVPMRDERRTIAALVATIRAQVRPPDEVLLVDGGSIDGTADLARRLTAGDPRFRVLEAGPATPGRGRNVGIAAARHAWIALTDAGILLEAHWLAALVQRVAEDPSLDAVFGSYEPRMPTRFEEAAALAYVPPKQLRDGHRVRGPVVASMLLRRSAWEAVGGFPDLRAAEDLLFLERIQRGGFRTAWAPAAVVHWMLPSDLRGVFRRFALYSRHNVQAGLQYRWHYGIARMYLAAAALLLLAVCVSRWWYAVLAAMAVGRVLRSVWTRRGSHRLGWLVDPRRLARVAWILVTIDAATFVGWLQALAVSERGRGRKGSVGKIAAAWFEPRAPGRLPPMRDALYIAYQSLEEPLTQTQVLPYLEGLTRNGYRLVLLTFEPRRPVAETERQWRAALHGRGIDWHWRPYHKWPTLPATAWDVLAGAWTGWRLVRRHGIRLVHARAHVPAVIGWILRGWCGTKLLFDVRGLMAEEYVDAGVWPAGGWLFRLVKRVERRLLATADGVVLLTWQVRRQLQRTQPGWERRRPVAVIPCCVDIEPRAAAPMVQSNTSPPRTIVYVGKLGGWYLTREMVEFMAFVLRARRDVRWQVWTQSDPRELQALIAAQGIGGQVSIGRLRPEDVLPTLRRAHAGLALIRPCASKRASSPTKVAEYLAAGLPVVSTAGIGDLDRLLDTHGSRPGRTGPGRVGALLREWNPAAYRRAWDELQQLWADPRTPDRCRALAARHFDLRSIGWRRYAGMYRRLIGDRPRVNANAVHCDRPSPPVPVGPPTDPGERR